MSSPVSVGGNWQRYYFDLTPFDKWYTFKINLTDPNQCAWLGDFGTKNDPNQPGQMEMYITPEMSQLSGIMYIDNLHFWNKS